MAISLSKNQLQQSIQRIKQCADQLGIRLGKGDDKAQRLICSVLDVPNWHVALSKSDSVSGNAYDSCMSKLREISNDALNTSMAKQVDEKSLIMLFLLKYKEMDSLVQFVSETNDSLKAIKLICDSDFDLMLPRYSKEYLDRKIGTIKLIDYFYFRLITEVPELFTEIDKNRILLICGMITMKLKAI